MRVRRARTSRLAAAVALSILAATAGSATALAGDRSTGTATREIVYREWTDAAQFAGGTGAGTAITGDALTLSAPVGTVAYTDPYGTAGERDYEYATWTSPRVGLSFTATEAIASWNADTPGGTWLQVELNGDTEAGTATKWYVLGRWAAGDTEIHRTSVPPQGDDDGFVAVDTFVARDGHALTGYQLRVTLYRPAGTAQTPTLRSIGAMASRLPSLKKNPVGPLGGAEGATLTVPQYSQEVHSGQYPQYDGGGEAWCSPTSTSMVVASWGTGPTPAEYSWVDPAFADPWVDHAARMTYDYAYQGAGNWPFNTAYAAQYGLDGFVTRLRSMTEAEQFINAGIPLVFSLAMKKNEVPGAGYTTNGHLLVVVGFTASGDAVINDPFAADNAGVRKVFSRAEFENAWLMSSGGIVYVIHPAGVALPPSPAQPNW